MKIVLPIYPLSLNRLLRLHWRTRGRKRDAWEGAIASRVGFGPWYAGRREVRAPRRARVSILVGREKLQDPDNCVGSVKVVLDALCRTGWIYDDGPEWVELEVEEVRAAKPFTVIGIVAAAACSSGKGGRR